MLNYRNCLTIAIRDFSYRKWRDRASRNTFAKIFSARNLVRLSHRRRLFANLCGKFLWLSSWSFASMSLLSLMIVSVFFQGIDEDMIWGRCWWSWGQVWNAFAETRRSELVLSVSLIISTVDTWLKSQARIYGNLPVFAFSSATDHHCRRPNLITEMKFYLLNWVLCRFVSEFVELLI